MFIPRPEPRKALKQVSEEFLEFLWQWAGKAEGFRRAWMREPEFSGMKKITLQDPCWERLAADLGGGTVECVPHYGMTDRGHVHANLVSASSLDAEF